MKALHAAITPAMKTAALLLAAAALAQEPADFRERDLKFTRDPARVVVAPGQRPGIPRSYALVVGISSYKNLPAAGQLKYPARDAASVYSTLISPEGGQFPPENVHRLVGADATLANLKRELEQWLPGVSRDDDRVVVYFAGHGFVHGGKAYLAPYDIDPANIAGSGYPMDELGRTIAGKIKGKWKVLLTDSCHSGAITPEADAEHINGSLLRLNSSLFSLTASRDREQSFESDIWGGGHGAFTYYVIQGLEGAADEDGDGAVTADELAHYTRVHVRRDTKARQNPTAERGSFDPKMILAFNPSRAKATPAAAPTHGGLIFEANLDAVEVFVDGKSQGTVAPGKPLRLPGVAPGAHTIQGVRQGYQPDGPREELVYPGQDTTVQLRISIAIRRKKAAVDKLNEGIEFYQRGQEKNYLRAVALCQEALALEADYAEAALYLGRAYSALFETAKARAAYERAIQINPAYAEAQTSLGGLLLDTGEVAGAIRVLEASNQRAPGQSLTNALMSQAFTRTRAYAQAETYGREAVKLNPHHAEAHFWLAEALRFGKQCPQALGHYRDYLRLSNFDSGLAGKLNYYVLGYLAGIGRKTSASQADIWRELREMAHFGLCDCSRLTKDFDAAIGYCQQALALDRKDFYAHYALGLSWTEKFNQAGTAGHLAAARSHFEEVIRLNGEVVEATRARKYLDNIALVITQLSQAGTAKSRP